MSDRPVEAQIADLEDTIWKRRWYFPLGPRLARVHDIEVSDLDGSIRDVVLVDAHKAGVRHRLGAPNRHGWPHCYRPARIEEGG